MSTHHLVDKKSVLDFIKAVATTATAIAVVITGVANYASDALDNKIQIMAEQTAKKTFQIFKIEDAVFQLQKEHDKFLHGKSDSIRKKNLELVLKYKKGVLDTYPSEISRMRWAEHFYKTHFIDAAHT